jgi:riboflavin transporter FmnP
MNPMVLAAVKQFWYRLPNWATSMLGFIFGMMIALGITTWDAILVFFDQPFHDWFGEIFNYIAGGLVVAGGFMLDPRAEKAPLLLTDVVEEENAK